MVSAGGRRINQGDIFWVDLGEPTGSGPGYRHPHVVVQNNLFNRSRIGTVVVCALTSNLRRAEAPGNVLLGEGEANLPRRSVVNISQIVTVDKDQLDEKIGTVSVARLREILDGIKLLLEPATLE
jgi:mRNA interferase MazF